MLALLAPGATTLGAALATVEAAGAAAALRSTSGSERGRRGVPAPAVLPPFSPPRALVGSDAAPPPPPPPG